MDLWQFFVTNFDEVATLTGQHLWMVLVAITVACAVGIPAGVLITRKPALEKGILGFANVVQTIPSLALFGFLIPVPVLGGIGSSTAIVALILYALLPIIRATYAGIKGVDPSVREAGRGMGMTDLQLLWQVEMPLALGSHSGRNSGGHHHFSGNCHDCGSHWRWRIGHVHLQRRGWSEHHPHFGGLDSSGSFGLTGGFLPWPGGTAVGAGGRQDSRS